jgi:hypothetical protein
VVAYDWDVAQPAHPVAAGRGDRSELEPGQLPEVRELVAEGWELAPDAPMYAFLPAVWPAHLRTWVPDRSTRYEQRYVMEPTSGAVLSSSTVPWSEATAVEVDDDTDELLAEGGIVGRPRGRLWLLKPPAGYASVGAFLDEVGRQADAADIPIMFSERYAELTARALAAAER